MDKDIAKETVLNTNATTPIEPIGGLPPNDSASMSAIMEAAKNKNFVNDIIQPTLMSMATGAKAGEQAASPFSAFLQGAMAGLQIPQALYQQKLSEIQSTLEAAPFGVTHPEIVNQGDGYKLLAGLPTKIALDIVKQIAVDTTKITKTAEEERKTQKERFENEKQLKQMEDILKAKSPQSLKDQIDIIKQFESLDYVKNFREIEPFYNDLITASNDALGDKTRLVSFAKMIAPTARVSEETMHTFDPSSVLGKFAQLWPKVVRGEELSPEERDKIRKQAMKIYIDRKQYYDYMKNKFAEKAVDYGFDASMLDNPKKIKSVVMTDGRVLKGYIEKDKFIPIGD